MHHFPLTITDFASRYLVACEARMTTQARFAFPIFERAKSLVCLVPSAPTMEARLRRRTRSTV
jgi:hypothetical protein